MVSARQPPRAAKAGRLLYEGRVSEVPGRIFRVQGDSDTYFVFLTEGADLCTCPWGRAAQADPHSTHCSHVLAAVAFSQHTPDPFEGLPK